MPDGLSPSLHAEVTTLGACLLDAVALRTALDSITPAHFALDSHSRIFRVMGELTAAGSSVDYVTVLMALQRNKGELDAIGGPEYLASLSEGVPRKAQVRDYIAAIKDHYVERQLLKVFDAGALEVSDGSKDVKTVIAAVSEQLQALQSEDVKYELRHVKDVFADYGNVDEMHEAMATTQGIGTGIAEFDKITMGYQPKCLIILAARPKMGKTAKMINDAYHAAVIERKKVALFTLEQDKLDVLRRMLSSVTQVPYEAIKARRLSREQKYALIEAQAQIMESDLYITDIPNLTATRIWSMCRWMKEHIGFDIGFIDQLSRLSPKDVQTRGMQKREIIGEQTNIFKMASQQLDAPIVLLCQLRRHEGKGDARPSLEALKDSGDIEEDADLVEFLHRPAYYDRGSTEPDEIIIAANREGDTGVCEVEFNGSIMRWQDRQGHHEPQQ